MTWTLALAILAMLLLAAEMFLVGQRLARLSRPRLYVLSATVVAASVFGYLYFIKYSIWQVRLMPVADLIVWGDWLLPVAGLLAGLAWSATSSPRWQKGVVVASLLAASLYCSFGWALRPLPRCHNLWQGDICMQTTPSTCSAASAATLLRNYGIPASEAEMADLCLTRNNGTSLHGLYRGLSLKTRHMGFEVDPFHGDLHELRRRTERGPVLLRVSLTFDADPEGWYTTELGWKPGVAHTVVCYRFVDEETVLIGDPVGGLEQWSLKDLVILWHGTGIGLIPQE